MKSAITLACILVLLLVAAKAPAQSSAPALLAPDAWGSIRSDGTFYFGNVGIASSVWNASSKRYEITYSGHSYGAQDVTIVNLFGDAGSCPAGATARQTNFAGKLMVYVVDADGVGIQCVFGFISFFASSRGGLVAPLDIVNAEYAPMAVGSIERSGAIGAGTFGLSASTWNATLGRYELDITGNSFSIRDIPAVSLIGDSAVCEAGAVIRHSSVSGKMLVYVYDAAGTAIQCPFQFFAYGADLDYLLLVDGFEGDAATAARLPSAFGYLNQFFPTEVEHAHNVDSMLWNATLERYEIALRGISYGIADRAVVSISGGPGSCPAGAVARVSSVSGLLLVYIVNSAGARIQCSFRFVVQEG